MAGQIHTRLLVGLLIIPFLMLLGCQPGQKQTVSQWLQPEMPMYVSFPLPSPDMVYSFNGDPLNPTQLSVYTYTPDLMYAAEVRDDSGNLVATLGGNRLQNTVLTLRPSNGLYEIALKAQETPGQGMLSLMVNSSGMLNPQPVSSPTPTYTDVSTLISKSSLTNGLNLPTCLARNTANQVINIRGGPGLGYAVQRTLLIGNSLTITGKTTTGWLQIKEGGWVNASVVSAEGACDTLPDVTPADGGLGLQLAVDRDGWGQLQDAIAVNDGGNDFVTFNVTNLTAAAPDNYREFTLTLLCTGTGLEALRWGSIQKPSLLCGNSITVPFTTVYNTQYIAVVLVDTSLSSAISYQIILESTGRPSD